MPHTIHSKNDGYVLHITRQIGRKKTFMTAIVCADCRKTIILSKKDGFLGYAITDDNKKICYTCSGRRTIDDMISTGRANLYFDWNRNKIIDWPNTIHFTIIQKNKSTGRVPTGQTYTRYDLWFRGPDGKIWYGINKGDNDIVRCRRKEKQ